MTGASFLAIGVCCSISIIATSQQFPVDTLLYSGTNHGRINLVFLSEGYQAHEMSKFKDDALLLLNGLFEHTPFKEYRNYFNAYAIQVPSNESGTDHQQLYKDYNLHCAAMPLSTVDTYFHSRFDNGIHHRLTADANLIGYVLADNFPLFDQVILLVNTPFYGGSGGGYLAFASANSESSWVVLHELGHTFGNLADEYWSGIEFEASNLTQESDPRKVRWNSWLGIDGIGIYAVPGSNQWFRPHQNCMMQVPGYPFCNVCIEALIEKIHDGAKPITEVNPPDSSFIELGSEDITLSLNPIEPDPNTLRITWKINNVSIAKNISQISIPVDLLNDGYYKVITAEVVDTIQLTRSERHIDNHSYIYQWFVNGLITGLEDEHNGINLQVWPNPSSGTLNISFYLSRTSDVGIQIIDLVGNNVVPYSHQPLSTGEHSIKVEIDRRGIYFAFLYINDLQIVRRILLQ